MEKIRNLSSVSDNYLLAADTTDKFDLSQATFQDAGVISRSLIIDYDNYDYMSSKDLRKLRKSNRKVIDVAVWRITTDGLRYFLEKKKKSKWADHITSKYYNTEDEAVVAFEKIILQARIDIMLIEKQLVKAEFSEKMDKADFENRTIVLANE